MFVENIKLKNYRNYSDLTLSFNERVNVVLGNNAQGKTNLIESIYICSIGKSFRTNKDIELIKFGEDISIVDLNYYRDGDTSNIVVSLNRDGRKIIKKDGEKLLKLSQLIENILIVSFSPEDLKIVKEEPEKRRKFIDRELSQISPAYLNNISSYKKILVQRNAYLKELNVNRDMLNIWDMQLAKYGVKIIEARRVFIEKISNLSREIHHSITEDRELLKLEYSPSIDTVSYEEYLDIIGSSRDNDIRLRTTSKGPHKDDFLFFINGINARSFGSQGQQRTSALSLKLAELKLIKEETKEDGILLLDDVMSELDLNRQKFLIKTLSDNQIFITTTNIDDSIIKEFPDSSIFMVTDGKIEKISKL